jgi:hypothetical protein
LVINLHGKKLRGQAVVNFLAPGHKTSPQFAGFIIGKRHSHALSNQFFGGQCLDGWFHVGVILICGFLLFGKTVDGREWKKSGNNFS